MKKILFTWLLALVAGAAAFALPMNDGHSLTALWKQYEEAKKADRPQKEAEILSQIKEEAMRQHLPLDFYDAATAYVNTVERRDWKQRDRVREQLTQEIETFNEPIVTFHWMRAFKRVSTDELWAYVKAHPDGFQGRTPGFYLDIEDYLGGTLKPFIRNDKEYVLWLLFKQRYYRRAQDDEVYQLLAAQVKGQYPNEAALEYYLLGSRYYAESQREQRRQDLSAFAKKYSGKAVSVYPRSELLYMQFIDLDRQKASGNQYQALYQLAQALEKERKAYKGTEADIAAGCKGPASLVNRLTESDISVEMDGSHALVCFQNLSKATLTLRRDGKTVKNWKLTNPVGSFYAPDSLSVQLPKLEDGEYTVEAVSGKYSDEDHYTQYTLSIATVTDSRGPCVYVTDYQSGKPLDKVTLVLLKSGKEVARSSLKLKGFTPLPAALARQLDEKSFFYLSAQSGDRKSPAVGIQDKDSHSIASDRTRCHVYRDCGAYNPGDTVQFKAVVYRGDPSLSLQVCAGKEVEVQLMDSEDNKLESLRLTTNEWGSVSGSFVLPKGLRNGWFYLNVVGLTRDSFRVDEFVLPSFDFTFDPVDKLYLAGDRVQMGGVLTSYSGHSLQGAKAAVKVEHYGTVVLEEELTVPEDNRLSFSFPTPGTGYYNVEVTLTDATGETLSFGRGLYVGDGFSIDASVPDAADAELRLKGEENERYIHRDATYTLTSSHLRMCLQVRDNNLHPVPLPLHYQVKDLNDVLVAEGDTPSGEEFSVKLPGGGLYKVVASAQAVRADGGKVSRQETFRVYCLPSMDTKLAEGAQRIFISGAGTLPKGEPIAVRLGSAQGDAHVVATLYAEENKVLETSIFRVPNGTVKDFTLTYKDAYPDAVSLQLFYFIQGASVRYTHQYRREKDRYTLPLQYTRFQDKAYPGTRYSFTLKTAPGAEVLVAAWDKSLDTIQPNRWSLVSLRSQRVYSPYISTACGHVGSGEAEGPILMRGMSLSKGGSNMVLAEAMPAAPRMDAEDGAAFADYAHSPAAEEEAVSLGDVTVREVFASSLTFQPHLRPNADGTLEFSFGTSDKLSTYYVRALAHDHEMHNALAEQEMVVSLPVKVALAEPRFLYEGDVYDAAVTVSSNVDHPVSGVMGLFVGETLQQLPVTVNPGQTITHRFRIQANLSSCHSERSEESQVTLKAVFKASDFSDAVQVTVPVYPAAQELTEAHSAVLRAGMSREALLKELRSRFVNIPAYQAALKEISVLDMVRDAIPSHVEPSGKDVLSLSEAWYVQLLAARLNCHSERSEESVDALDSDLLDKVLSCRNADGGFGWFEGMSSSPMITAVLLERFAKLRDRGFEVPDVISSVKYLDTIQFGEGVSAWRGGISDAQYLHVRSLYAGVPFEVKPVSETGKKRWAAFQKWAKSYLTPSKKDGRGMQGQILAKARRLRTLQNLLERDGGTALAKTWGVTLRSSLNKSLKADVQSLLEYAVEHRDGGYYYPNAVMPWRGLLESEAYAHALLCDLLSPYDPNITDGIRLWLMLQKETQHWDTEPAFIDAITAILDGSEAVLDTRVLILSGNYEAPFQDVKASGNGFKIERKFYKETTVERLYDDKTGPNDLVSEMVEIQPGDVLAVGDKVLVRYVIWNAENRSFVKLTAGREAALQPVQQLSGHLGYGFFRPFGGYRWEFVPQGYRNVKASCTEYYFDSYPEENTRLFEEFYVQQAGRFVAPTVVIESLYAPHYRANSASRPALEVTERR